MKSKLVQSTLTSDELVLRGSRGELLASLRRNLQKQPKLQPDSSSPDEFSPQISSYVISSRFQCIALWLLKIRTIIFDFGRVFIFVVFHFGHYLRWSLFTLVLLYFGHSLLCSFFTLVIICLDHVLRWSLFTLVVFDCGNLLRLSFFTLFILCVY